MRRVPPSFARNNSAVGVAFPALIFVCRCSVGYEDSGDGICSVIPPFWSTGRIAALVIGGILAAAACLLYLGVPRYRKRQRQLKANLALHQGLLEESQGEVLALKRAWDISPDEIVLEKRIDQDSEGAFGEVWRGRWGDFAVAVKVLKLALLQLDEETAAEFEREVDFMQRTRHPHIVRFFGAGRMRDDAPFLVEELMATGSLKVCLRAGRVKGWATKLQIAQDVASGMHYIHKLGHIHRDLKSGNVLMSGSMRAKVADFGSVGGLLRQVCAPQGDDEWRHMVTQSYSSAASDMTAFVGTPMYMSREMLRGDRYDASTDVWSFGVLLWELASEERPDLIEAHGERAGVSIVRTLLQLLDANHRLHMRPEWPVAVQKLIGECWGDNPERRPTFDAVEQRLVAIKAQ